VGTLAVNSLIFIILLLLIVLPFSYNWVAKRNKYLLRLRSIGFEENDRGLIRKTEGVGKSTETFFSPDYEGASYNPGLVYTIASSQFVILLLNSVISIYTYIIYKIRIGRQRRAYNQVQLKLLEQIESNDGDCTYLKDAFSKEFYS
jgi:hypothetical protein